MQPIRVFTSNEERLMPVAARLTSRGFQRMTFAEDQPEYHALPAMRSAPKDDPTGPVITRWRLTWRERLRVLWRGDLFLSLLTFGGPLQPVYPATTLDEVADALGVPPAEES